MTTERYRAIINEGSKRRAVEGDACRAHAVDWREVAYELAKRYTAAMITYAPGTYDARDTLDSAIAEVCARGKG